jgi:undecaprenyl-diphosphatase
MRISQPKLERWHVIGLLGGLAFVLLLAFARLDAHVLDTIDIRTSALTAPLRTYGWVRFFLAITVLGSGLGIAVVGTGAAILLWARIRIERRLAIAVLATAACVELAKDFVERQRPSPVEWVTPLHSYSFPSGHTAMATALYGFLLIVLYRHSRTNFGATFAIAVPSLVILAVALSRIVLSVHYLTDVVGGFLLGLFWLTMVFAFPHKK